MPAKLQLAVSPNLFLWPYCNFDYLWLSVIVVADFSLEFLSTVTCYTFCDLGWSLWFGGSMHTLLKPAACLQYFTAVYHLCSFIVSVSVSLSSGVYQHTVLLWGVSERPYLKSLNQCPQHDKYYVLNRLLLHYDQISPEAKK